MAEEKYTRLYDEFKNRPMKHQNDFQDWNQHLRGQFNNNGEVQLLRDWMRKQFSQPRPDVSLPYLAQSISSANWKQSNDSMQCLTSAIISTRYDSTQIVQDLGWTWGKFRMGLKINGQPLTPLPTGSPTAKAYDVDLLSPGIVLGIRYSCADNKGNRDLLIAPLGHIFLSPMSSDKDDNWLDAKLALMLEILKDGTAGKLLLVGNKYEQLSGEMDNAPTRLPDQPKFTVAQVDETVGLVPKSPNNDPDIGDKLRVESILGPLIVETGVKLESDMEGVLPIALFPLDKIGQEME